VKSKLSNLDDEGVALIAQQKQITPAIQDIFHRVLDQKNKVGAFGRQVTQRQQEVGAITKDQNRLRENMKALKGSAEERALLQRYTKQLDSQEDRLSTLGHEIAELQGKHSQAEADLDQLVQSITLDQDF
jgi:predicted  nucleic acid-binding Zn-ribbon protein